MGAAVGVMRGVGGGVGDGVADGRAVELAVGDTAGDALPDSGEADREAPATPLPEALGLPVGELLQPARIRAASSSAEKGRRVGRSRIGIRDSLPRMVAVGCAANRPVGWGTVARAR
jgi:hypothetical protein